MRELIKGGNAPVPGGAPLVAVRWRTGGGGGDGGDVDVAAFLLRADGKVAGDRDMVFHGRRESGGGAVRLRHPAVQNGSRSEAVFAVRLAELPPDVERIAFTGTIDQAAAGFSFSRVEGVEIAVADGGTDTIRFPVPTAGASETALILGELYRRDGAWKFRAVGQGFDGGLGPLAQGFGVDVAAATDAPVALVPPAPPAPVAPPVPSPKITLDKARPTIGLAKTPGGFGEIRVNLNWNRGPGGGGASGRPQAVDLDVGCLFELRDGSKGTVQALGASFGSFDEAPYIELSGDDRTGSIADGEWLSVNGRHWGEIRRVLLYAFIYEGVPNWAATDGVATVYVPGAAPVEVRLEDGGELGLCAVALIENAGGEMRISREVAYFRGHRDMDEAFRWGLRWTETSKDATASTRGDRDGGLGGEDHVLDWLKGNAAAVRRGLSAEVSKYKNREFMEAVVAGCALVAAADGNISSQEKQKMVGFIQNSDELKVFRLEDVIQFFNGVVGKFEFDREIGRAEALKVLGRLRKNESAARIMVRVCCVIGGSDGIFDDAERKAVRAICAELGLNPADFDL